MLEKFTSIRGTDILEKFDMESSPYQKSISSNNKAFISGIIVENFSPVIYWNKKFYTTKVRVLRLSGVEDLLPIVVSPSLISKNFLSGSVIGKWIEVAGEITSYNSKHKNGNNHVLLFLLARNINICNAESELQADKFSTIVYINGYLCKPPEFRETKYGKSLSRLIIATHNLGHIMNYIPSIAWSKFAYETKNFKLGESIQFYGRFQSRLYFKPLSSDFFGGEVRETYEVSIFTIW